MCVHTSAPPQAGAGNDASANRNQGDERIDQLEPGRSHHRHLREAGSAHSEEVGKRTGLLTVMLDDATNETIYARFFGQLGTRAIAGKCLCSYRPRNRSQGSFVSKRSCPWQCAVGGVLGDLCVTGAIGRRVVQAAVRPEDESLKARVEREGRLLVDGGGAEVVAARAGSRERIVRVCSEIECIVSAQPH